MSSLPAAATGSTSKTDEFFEKFFGIKRSVQESMTSLEKQRKELIASAYALYRFLKYSYTNYVYSGEKNIQLFLSEISKMIQDLAECVKKFRAEIESTRVLVVESGNDEIMLKSLDEMSSLNPFNFTDRSFEEFDNTFRPKSRYKLYTPLHMCANSPYLPPLRLLDHLKLLITHGASVNSLDSMNRTPLHVAVIRGSVDSAMHLCHIDPSVLNQEDKTGLTPFQLAVTWRQYKLASLFIELAQKKKIPLKMKTGNTNTIFHQIFDEHSQDPPQEFLALLKGYLGTEFHELIKAQGLNKRTVIHESLRDTRRYSVNLVQYFLENGTDVNAQDKQGNTALHYVLLKLLTGNPTNYQKMHNILITLLQAAPNLELKNQDDRSCIDLCIDLMERLPRDSDIYVLLKKEARWQKRSTLIKCLELLLTERASLKDTDNSTPEKLSSKRPKKRRKAEDSAAASSSGVVSGVARSHESSLVIAAALTEDRVKTSAGSFFNPSSPTVQQRLPSRIAGMITMFL